MSWNDTAVVVAHFDPAGRVARYLADFVAYVARHTRTVVVVSTGMSEASAAALAAHARVIVRENVGYDFWSYKVGIEALGDLGAFKRLWVVNSSILILDPERFCGALLDPAPTTDLLGLTRSSEHSPHVNSYSVVFQNPAVINSWAFADWWGRLRPISDRIQVILQQEIGMSRHFAQAGFSLGAVFAPRRDEQLLAVLRAIETRMWEIPAGGSGLAHLDPAQSAALFPAHYCWEGLLERYGIVKLDLLRKAFHHIIDVRALHARLRADPRHRSLYEDALAS